VNKENRRRWIRPSFFLLALVLAFAVWRGLLRSGPVRTKVLRLVAQISPYANQSSAAEAELTDLGPEAYLELGKVIDRRDSGFNRLYASLWPRLPKLAQKHLPIPQSWGELRRRVATLVCDLGPGPSRPLASALCKSLDPSDPIGSQNVLRALYWSIPESPKAVATLADWLRTPAPGKLLFGTTDSYELWPQLPQMAPLLVPWLKDPDQAGEAAGALGTMGTNAIFAVPSLIEMVDQGVAGKPPNLKLAMGYASYLDPFNHNRLAAIGALGTIGRATPEVVAALTGALSQTNEAVRFEALLALARLHQPLGTQLENVLNGLRARRTFRLGQYIELLGKLGASARGALPWLRQFAALEEVARLPGAAENENDFLIEPERFRAFALAAICRIAPDEARSRLPGLVAQVGVDWDPVQTLMELKPLGREVIAELQPLLRQTNWHRSALAANIILTHEPTNAEALSALRRAAAEGELNQRLIPAGWLWQRTGETEPLLSLAIEGLKSPQSHIGQSAAQYLGEMGAGARPAIPALKAALWHKDKFVRQRAGKVLRKLAPEEMPLIQ